MPEFRIDLWLAVPPELEPAALDELRGWISDGERERADRYLRAEDTRRSIVGRGLSRFALARRTPGRLPEEWELLTTEGSDRPIATGTDLQFSISHTAGLVAVAVANTAVGVDVEPLARRTSPESIAGRWFHPRERAVIEATAEPSRTEVFLQLWTLKEAYAKARGLGLELPLDSIRFEGALEPGGAPSLYESEELVEGWSFRTLGTNTHRLAVAVQAEELALRVWEFPADRERTRPRDDLLGSLGC